MLILGGHSQYHFEIPNFAFEEKLSVLIGLSFSKNI